MFLFCLPKIDVLMFIHSNEYVHGNINAENIYIKTEGQSQVKRSYSRRVHTSVSVTILFKLKLVQCKMTS